MPIAVGRTGQTLSLLPKAGVYPISFIKAGAGGDSPNLPKFNQQEFEKKLDKQLETEFTRENLTKRRDELRQQLEQLNGCQDAEGEVESLEEDIEHEKSYARDSNKDLRYLLATTIIGFAAVVAYKWIKIYSQNESELGNDDKKFLFRFKQDLHNHISHSTSPYELPDIIDRAIDEADKSSKKTQAGEFKEGFWDFFFAAIGVAGIADALKYVARGWMSKSRLPGHQSELTQAQKRLKQCQEFEKLVVERLQEVVRELEKMDVSAIHLKPKPAVNPNSSPNYSSRPQIQVLNQPTTIPNPGPIHYMTAAPKPSFFSRQTWDNAWKGLRSFGHRVMDTSPQAEPLVAPDSREGVITLGVILTAIPTFGASLGLEGGTLAVLEEGGGPVAAATEKVIEEWFAKAASIGGAAWLSSPRSSDASPLSRPAMRVEQFPTKFAIDLPNGSKLGLQNAGMMFRSQPHTGNASYASAVRPPSAVLSAYVYVGSDGKPYVLSWAAKDALKKNPPSLSGSVLNKEGAQACNKVIDELNKGRKIKLSRLLPGAPLLQLYFPWP
jgi:hypothetical protein